MPLATPARTWRAQRGVTLIELMVGLTIGLLITTVLLRLFADASDNGANVQRAAAQLDNGRYAGELLRDELRLAGFFGEVATGPVAFSDPAPCSLAPAAVLASPLTLPAAVHGYRPAEAVPCLGNRKAGTAAIALRRVDTESIDPATIGSTAQMYLQHSFCQNDPATTPLVYAAERTSFTLRGSACTAANRVRAYVPRIYFVAGCNRCGERSDGIPTLKRVELVDGVPVETPLVEGVEELLFEFGFDTDGNGAPDIYRAEPSAAGPASLWSDVMAVRVHYVTRSLTRAKGTSALSTTQTFDFGSAGTVTRVADGFVRHAYSSTVRLLNPSGARDIQ